MRTTLLAADGSATIDAVVTACLAESGRGQPGHATSTVVAGVGTTAAHALRGELLREALGDRGVTLGATQAFTSADDMLAAPGWDVALVLSPWKQRVLAALDHLTPSASETGVVDTIVRGQVVTGLNTNTWAAQAAMETLLGGRVPASVLILGSGASAYSVALACRRIWPQARMTASARNVGMLAAWSARFDAASAAPSELSRRWGTDGPELIVNTTTWGETEESETRPFAFDLDTLLRPGNRLFDLNNRSSLLQHTALRAGMSVMSGTFMQRATNACRAALAQTGH